MAVNLPCTRINFFNILSYIIRYHPFNCFMLFIPWFNIKFVNVHISFFIMLYNIFKYYITFYNIAPKIGILANGLLGPNKSPFPS